MSCFCAPEEKIKLFASEYYKEKIMPVVKFDKLYRQMNEIRQTDKKE